VGEGLSTIGRQWFLTLSIVTTVIIQLPVQGWFQRALCGYTSNRSGS
jgi:hypothetical protein